MKSAFSPNKKAIKTTDEFDTIEELIDEENRKMSTMNIPKLHVINNVHASDKSLLKQMQIRSKIISSTMKLAEGELHLNRNNEENSNLLLNLNMANAKRRLSMIHIGQPIEEEKYDKEYRVNTVHLGLYQPTTTSLNYNNINIKRAEAKPVKLNNSLLPIDIPKNSSSSEDEEEAKIDTMSMQSIIEPKISSPPKSPSRWRKVANVLKSINSLRKYVAKPIGNESDIDDDLRDYKERLLDNTLKVRQSSLNENHTITSFVDDFKETVRKAMTCRIYKEKTEIKKNLKEAILGIIIDGGINWEENVDKIFRLNPERYTRDGNDPLFLFNTPLGNGKTLLYIACQEGKFDIVKYFLNKNLNAFVKSKIGEACYESPLECSCRWNYVMIVNLLLERVPYCKKDINDALKIDGLSAKMKKILKQYKKEKFSNSLSCC